MKAQLSKPTTSDARPARASAAPVRRLSRGRESEDAGARSAQPAQAPAGRASIEHHLGEIGILRPEATPDVHPTGNAIQRLAPQVADPAQDMPTPQLQRACTCAGACADCEEKTGPGTQLRRLTSDWHERSAGAAEAPPIVHDVIRGAGRPLDSATRSHFEGRLGHDFSSVQVHTGDRAARSAAAVNALAYTVGDHVVLGTGLAASQHGAHGRVLSHELVHVTQWAGRPIPSRIPIGAADGPAERAAHTGSAGAAAAPALQRLVQVCEDYQAQDPSTANPGPGLRVNVSASAKRARVNARLQVHGAEADAAKASTIQGAVSSNWNGSFPDGFTLGTSVNVSHRAEGQSEDSNATQIELVRAGEARPSHVTRNWLVGSRYVSLNLDYPGNQLGWVAAHEFGHLLALSDRYSESIWSTISSLFGGGRTATVQAGYENNIMGVDNGRLESRNVRDLIARHTQYQCVRWGVESPLG